MPIASQILSNFKGDYLSARMCGCKVDGVTDDTTSINAAMLAASEIGVPLMIPGGQPLMASFLHLPSGLTLIGRPGATVCQIGQINLTFSGNGLNDASSGGPYTLTGTAIYTVIIDHVGTPDTFKWNRNGGSFTTGVAITGAAQALNDGITIKFGATTGHNLGDQWSISVDTTKGATANTPFVSNLNPSSGNSNILLQGITWDGNGANQAVTGVDIISIQNVLQPRIVNCGFQNAVRAAIFGQRLTQIDIDRCNFYNWGIGSVAASTNLGGIYLASRASNNFGGTGGTINGVRITGCTLDGRGQHTSCIKLDAGVSFPMSAVIVSGNHIYVGDGSLATTSDTTTLAIELYSGDPGTTSISNFTVSGNVIEPETTPTTPNAFGISIGGAGCINGVVGNNSIVGCGAFGIETIGSQITVIGNTSVGCGEWTVDGGTNNINQVVLDSNIIIDPFIEFGFHNGIHIIAHHTNGPGPYGITDVIIRNNIIASSYTTNNNLIIIEAQVSGYNIERVQVNGNHLIGASTSNGSGISIGPNVGNCNFLTIQDNYFANLDTGINQGGTNSRYLFNRFESTVTTQYGTTFPTDAMVVDIDTGDSNFTPQTIKIRNQVSPVLAANGDIVIVDEAAALQNISGADGATNTPNLMAVNGVAFGSGSPPSPYVGSIISINSRWAGFPNWSQVGTSSYTNAMFMQMCAARFGISFGAASNADGSTPGTLAFFVEDGAGGVGEPGVYTARNYPIFPEGGGGTGAAIYSRSGPPGFTAGLGSIYLDYANDKGPYAYGAAGWRLIGFFYQDASVTGIRTDNAVGINHDPTSSYDLTTQNSIVVEVLGQNMPVLTDVNRGLTTGKIDIGNGATIQVKATGVSASQILQWDSTANHVVGITGIATASLTQISSGPTSAAFVDSIDFVHQTYTTSNAIISFGITTHNVVNGIVMT